jgi:hypothetical protein
MIAFWGRQIDRLEPTILCVLIIIAIVTAITTACIPHSPSGFNASGGSEGRFTGKVVGKEQETGLALAFQKFQQAIQMRLLLVSI